jgi:hypothetical protein
MRRDEIVEVVEVKPLTVADVRREHEQTPATTPPADAPPIRA